MDADKAFDLFGNAAGWAVVIYFNIRIGNAIVEALRELKKVITEHTASDISSQAAIKQDIVRMDARLEKVDDKVDNVLDKIWETGVGTKKSRPGRLKTSGDGE